MTLAFPLAVSAAALAAPVAAAVSDFRLPDERPQAPPTDLQGPVAPDVPASRRAPAPTPSPSASRTEAPSTPATRPPVEVPSGLQAQPSASATRRAVMPQTTGAVPVAPTSADLLQPVPTATPGPATVTPPPVAQAAVVPSEVPPDQGGWSWLWLLAAATAVLALLASAWAARRWAQRPAGPVAVPQIERPRVGAAGALADTASAAPGEPLQITLEPLRLSLTLMNATLTYRLELVNRGAAPLLGLAIGADMIAAHASMSREEQLAGPLAGHGAPAQRIERLDPGETRVVEGEFRLPFPQIVPIRQGSAALLLPLARFRVEADGAQPLVRTFVVGQPGQGRNLQPFRLDQGPRVYPKLAQHAFA